MLRPDKQFYEGEVRSLTAAEPDGQISLLPGHMPMFINITTGMASLTEADGTKGLSPQARACWRYIGTKSFCRAIFSPGKKKLEEAIRRRETAMAQERNGGSKASANIA
ncbi:MAG: hypothetical protein ACLR06_13315 [Christensenellaceae bacterium]